MKKTLLFVLLSILTLSVSSQKIEKNIIDDFTGTKLIYTSWEKIKGGNGMTGKNNFSFRFRCENDIVFFELKWVTDRIVSIREDSNLIFKMNENYNVTVQALSFVISSKGAGATGIQMSGIEGIDPIYVGEFEAFLTGAFVTKFRINTSDGYVDIDLKEKDARKINIAYQLLIDEFQK